MHRYRALALVSLAELLAMGLWFGVSAVAPQIAKEWQLDAATTAWLTLGVQLGFVAGTLLSATLNLPDVLNVRRLFALCAFLGAVANALLAWLATGVAVAIALRFLTGMFLAGVYPPGMKIIATWFKTGRGFALGVLIGALTLGKASPYLVNVIGSGNWRVNAGILSLLAALSPPRRRCSAAAHAASRSDSSTAKRRSRSSRSRRSGARPSSPTPRNSPPASPNSATRATSAPR